MPIGVLGSRRDGFEIVAGTSRRVFQPDGWSFCRDVTGKQKDTGIFGRNRQFSRCECHCDVFGVLGVQLGHESAE